MSEVQSLLAGGVRPAGDGAHQLTDAILCLARNVDHVEADKMVAELLLPAHFRAMKPGAVMSRIYSIHETLTSPSPSARSIARGLATQLAYRELPFHPTHPAAPAATYEGKHRHVT
jgi:hypothetical protein